MTKNFFIILFLISVSYFTHAQVTNTGQPKSWELDLTSEKSISLPDFDLKSLQKEDKMNDQSKAKPYRFGFEHQVSLGFEDGSWNTLKDGSRIWLLNITSKGAKTLNFIFDEFYLPKGAKLYFYNDDKTDLLGAYTSSQNRKDMQFGSWLVDGDNIWVEYYEPANTEFKGQLHISNVVHGYRSVTDIASLSKALNSSGDCNQDVDCPVGNDFDNLKNELKKSVALVLKRNSFCSGTLINNTNNDKAPYLLTANHCLDGSLSTWSFRFNWRSPNPSCATTTNSTNGDFDQTLSGATLLASNSHTDFALLEIDAPLQNDWDLVWAGWDRSDDIPDFTVGIHHPDGDTMKVSRDDDSPLKTSIPFNGAENVNVWYLNEWELGVTEPGSSGSAIFDQNGRIVGQLAGGAAACDKDITTSNNGQYDVYGRFGVSWGYGRTASSRLKDWLDPQNTGATVLDKFPPIYDNDIALKVDFLDEKICGDKAFPRFNILNEGNEVVTSAILTYQLENNSEVTVNWSGSLALGESEEITSATLDLNNGNLFNASIEINGIQDESIVDNTYSRIIDNYQNESYTTETITLTLLTDLYPDETSWVLYDENGNLVYQNTKELEQETTYVETFDVNPSSCYQFVILDSAGDGICCGVFGDGSYTLETDSGEIIMKGGEFSNQETTDFKINSTLTANSLENISLIIYPNPTDSFINIQSSSSHDFEVELYDMTGKQIIQTKINSRRRLDLNSYSNGVYFLKINYEDTSIIKKIVKH